MMSDNTTIFYLGFTDTSLPEAIQNETEISVEETETNYWGDMAQNVDYVEGTRKYDNKGLATCYCKQCKKAFVSSGLLNKKHLFNIEVRKATVVQCPSCNASVLGSEMKGLETQYMMYRDWFIQNDHKIRIRFKTIEYKYYRHRLVPITRAFMYTINMKTGMSYKFTMLTNGKPAQGARLRNCTYNNVYGYFYDMKPYTSKCKNARLVFEEVYNHIRNYKMSNTVDYYIPTLEEHFPDYCQHAYKLNPIIDADCNPIELLPPTAVASVCRPEFKSMAFEFKLDTLFMFNRLPSLNPSLGRTLYTTTYMAGLKKETLYKTIMKARKVTKQDEKDALRKLLEEFNIPVNKMNKNRLKEGNLNFIMNFLTLSKVMPLDNIYKIIDILDASVPVISTYFTNNPVDKKTMNNFCNKIVKYYKKTEDGSTYNKWARHTDIYIADIFRSIKLIYEHDAEYKIDLRMDIKELHDKVASDYNHFKHKNIEIDYSHLTADYSGKYGNLTFNLAKDTHELIDVGQTMRICVGSYRDRALKHRCYIVVARDNDNNPIVCIEIDHTGTSLIQTKLKYNNSPTPEIAELITQWCNDYNLDKDCYDMNPQHIQQMHVRNEDEVAYI